MANNARPRPRSADDESFRPQGGVDVLEGALKRLQSFGGLQRSRVKFAKSDIEENATHYNRLCSSEYRPPLQSRIKKDLGDVGRAARSVIAALKKMNYVSECWLTGAPDPIPLFRYRPAVDPSDPIAVMNDPAWNGPADLHRDDKYVQAATGAFGFQILKARENIDREEARVASEKSSAIRRMGNTESEQEYRSALQDFGDVKPAFNSHLDLIVPLMLQMEAVSEMAHLAEREFCKQWPKGKGGRHSVPLAPIGKENWLASECWHIVADFCGPDGVGRIKTTSDGDFGEFVKGVAQYATGYAVGGGKFKTGINYAIRMGAALIKRSEDRGVDFFCDYHRARRFK